jgi:hypothetical protein
MTFEEITDILQTQDEFGDLGDWTIATIAEGGTSAHTYRFTSGRADYFVKETQDNERNTLQLLAGLELDVCPRVVYPDLLAHNVLVMQYVPGDALKTKQLEPQLIEKYAVMQNTLNNWQRVQECCPDTSCTFSDTDSGIYRGFVLDGCRDGYQRLMNLGQFGLPILDDYTRLADRVIEGKETLAAEYSALPFGWLHHDFREENIRGRPQMLVDWGSSYGHGPFLFDLVPFLLLDADALEVFAARSDICRKAGRAQVEEWLRLAGLASFVAFLVWRVPDPEREDHAQTRDGQWAEYLEYEFEPYRLLLA